MICNQDRSKILPGMTFYQICIRLFFTMVIKLILKSRQQKNVLKYLYPPLLATEDELLNRNNFPALVWTCTSIFHFWLISLAAVETTKTPSGKLRWILNNINSV